MQEAAAPPPLLEQLLGSLAGDTAGAHELPPHALLQFTDAARAADGAELLGLVDATIHAAGVLAAREGYEPAARDLLRAAASLSTAVYDRALRDGRAAQQRDEGARRQAQRQAVTPSGPGVALPAPPRKKSP